MSIWLRLILGPIGMVIGVLLMKYSFQLTEMVGKIGFAEQIFKSPLNGTYTWWKLLGLGVIVVSALLMFGYLDIFSTPSLLPQ